MKLSKIILGLALILFAAVGAFATAKNTALITVYYNWNDQCLPAEQTPCDPTGSADCEVLITPPGSSAQLLPIFAQQVDIDEPCAQPFTKRP